MVFITIGQAAGLIAFGVQVVRILLPLSIIILLVSCLQHEHNAITWSVVSRTVQGSLWPTILRTDSVSSRKVSLRVLSLTWLITLSIALLTVAGIVTPLGLSQSIKPHHDLVTAHFVYSQDTTAFGFGTAPRYNRFSRLCSSMIWRNCPGRDDGYDYIKNSTGWYGVPRTDDAYINSTIPSNITEVFSSATSDDGNTLSGAFDIQYRTWAVAADTSFKLVDKGEPYAVGKFRSLDSLILRNQVVVIEGLIVDTVQGGVAFRNHTIPSGFTDGAEWDEDLTWVEPVTSCIDTNLTFLIQMGTNTLNMTGISMVDNGGFSDLPRSMPFFEQSYASQDLDLSVRATRGAWANNALFMDYFGVSYPGNTGPRNTSKGREFPLRSSYKPTLYGVSTTQIDGHFLDLSSSPTNISALNLSSDARTRLSVTSQNFTWPSMSCSGFGTGDSANISNVAINCGYVLGAPRRADGKESLIFEPQTNYTQNLHVCATGVQASIKTIKFAINGSASLANLEVVDVRDKVYASNASKPLWAVEKTGMNISDVNALWGLVHDRYENSENLWTIRREKFWLPAIATVFATITSASDSLASTSTFGAALAEVYNIYLSGSTGLYDYSGQTNLALNRLWQTYSQNASTTGNIVNRIYTDMIATALVGTKSAIMHTNIGAQNNDGTTPPSNALAQVRKFELKVQYSLLYAIPAFFVLLLSAIMLLAALVMWIARRFSMADLRQLLNQSSTGRTMTNILYPELCDPRAPTAQWIDKAGTVRLALVHGSKGSVKGNGSQDYANADDSPSLESTRCETTVGRDRKMPEHTVLSQSD